MKEMRVRDSGNLEVAANLCMENNLGIEVKGVINLYME